RSRPLDNRGQVAATFPNMSGTEQDDEWPQSSWKVCAVILWLSGFAFAFFQIDLPNSGSPPVNRTDIWMELPELLFYSVVPHPDAPAGGWVFFPQRLPIIVVGIWMLAGIWGSGHLLLRAVGLRSRLRRIEITVFAFGLGISGVSLMVLGAGLLAQQVPDALSRGTLGGALIVFALTEAVVRRATSRPHVQADEKGSAGPSESTLRKRPDADFNWSRLGEVLLRGQVPFGVLARAIVSLAIILFLTAMAFGAMLPSVDFDVKEYHLQGPKEWFLAGAITLLPHNVYTSFPFLTEMFHLLGMELFGDWFAGALAGKLVLMMFAPLTGLAVFAAADRLFDRRAAWAAMLIHVSTPWTYRVSIIAYAEGGLTFFLMATVLAVLIRVQSPTGKDDLDCSRSTRRLTLLTGLLAGSAMACKYPGLLSVVFPAATVLLLLEWRSSRDTSFARRVIILLAVFGAGCCVTIGPWLLKNMCETGNPVYPLMNSVFHGIDWTPTLEANWKRTHGAPHHQPFDLLVKFYDVTLKSDWLSPLLFSLAPLAFLTRWNRRVVASLWLYVGFLFLSWWLLTHRIDRFWIPMIPVVALLAGGGVWWTTTSLWKYGAGAFVTLCVLFNLGFITTTNCGLNAWLGDLEEIRDNAEFTSEPVAYLNRIRLPTGSKVLCVGEAQVFDARFPLVYNTVFDISLFEQWCSADEPDVPAAEQKMKPIDEIRQCLKAEGITHILVNWQEVLRYRTTYGITEFLAPHRFENLQHEGVLRPEVASVSGARPMKSFRDVEKDEILKWAPQLVIQQGSEPAFLTSQLFLVTKTGNRQLGDHN
ncbi:MAG: glycosyltransferase family 39 protein, partial [Planctomycetota bacterium]|nr:glycosyltransferase family 39 protein [Planctomycetota bacterium]